MTADMSADIEDASQLRLNGITTRHETPSGLRLTITRACRSAVTIITTGTRRWTAISGDVSTIQNLWHCNFYNTN